jgi:hypothetical protein
VTNIGNILAGFDFITETNLGNNGVPGGFFWTKKNHRDKKSHANVP